MNGLNKVLLLLVIVVFILCGCMFLDLYFDGLVPEETEPSTETTAATEKPAETTQATTVPVETTVPTTEATTEATVEETTEATTEPETEPEPEEDEDLSIGEKIAQIALEQIDKPFIYGTAGPDSFDASGLVQYCYAQVGISVPRSTAKQAAFGKELTREEMRPGDALFIWMDNPGEGEFVGIYVGDGYYVCAKKTGTYVCKVDVTTSYYMEHFAFARRFY